MKTGRPKIDAGEKKGRITGVRLRLNERELLEKAAAIGQKNLSEWMRQALVSTAEKQINNGFK
jgi:uncharacterized protein (DUF1778 family)